MRFSKPFKLTFWFSGGDLIRAGKPLRLSDAERLTYFFDNTAGRCLAKGDVDGAKFCKEQLRQLGDALRKMDEWARAGGAVTAVRSMLAASVADGGAA